MRAWRALLSIGFVVLPAACTPVAAYQRGPLAQPSMRPEYAESPARQHVQAIHEGALGGSLGVGTGCGCN